MRINRFLLFFLFTVLFKTSLFPSNWTRFRGPNGTGKAMSLIFPNQWEKNAYLWSLELPGVGHSSPVIWENKVFTTCADEKNGDQYILCINSKNGKVLWQKKIQSVHYRHHKFNSFASSTPCVDKDLLIVSWTTKKTNDLLCFDHNGVLKWRRNFGEYLTQHGSGFSPILYQEKVFITHDHEGDSAILALDRKTGETIWRTNRIGSKPSASTPCVYSPQNGSPQLISNSMSHGCYSIDIESGKVLWETGLDSLDKRSVSSPVQSGDFFLATCGSGGRGSRLIAVHPPAGPTLKVPATYTLSRNVPYVPTPLPVGSFIFLLTDGGIVSCVKRETGKILWKERVEGNYFASPIIIKGIIFIVSTEGVVTTLQINEEKMTILGNSQLNELTHNTPAVGNSSLFFRTYSKLFCLPSKSL